MSTNKPRNSYVYNGRVIEYWFYQHPLFPNHRYIARARRKMAEHLGRTLGPWEDVHHKNENRADDRISNLQLLPRGAHSSLHSKGRPLSEAAKKRLSKALKGRDCMPETRRKISAGNRGKKRSEAMRAAQSQRQLTQYRRTGWKHSEETRIKMSLAHIGKKRSEEAKLQMRISARNRKR